MTLIRDVSVLIGFPMITLFGKSTAETAFKDVLKHTFNSLCQGEKRIYLQPWFIHYWDLARMTQPR
jgi:hypothetical protein